MEEKKKKTQKIFISNDFSVIFSFSKKKKKKNIFFKAKKSPIQWSCLFMFCLFFLALSRGIRPIVSFVQVLGLSLFCLETKVPSCPLFGP